MIAFMFVFRSKESGALRYLDILAYSEISALGKFRSIIWRGSVDLLDVVRLENLPE